ncbi:MAG: phosphotransferase family protein [Firmicutes bacterium]|nr:phosphotransferase family protein [Bacillota bacterium]
MATYPHEHLDHVLRRAIPEWEAHSILLARLDGGLTNHNYSATVGPSRFFVRVGAAEANALGIDRDQEHQASQTAARLGVAPAVRYYVPEERLMVLDYVPGRALTPEDFQEPLRIRQVADLLKRVHQSLPALKPFSVFDVVHRYWHQVNGKDRALGERLKMALTLADTIRATIPGKPYGLCHNDLLAANFIWEAERDRLWLVDWEYAGLGSAYFDLGNFAANQELSLEAETELAALYFGVQNLPTEVARIHLMRVMSNVREALWGFVQHLVSPLDYDFKAYGLRHWQRVEQAVTGPAVDEALKVLSSPRSPRGFSYNG